MIPYLIFIVIVMFFYYRNNPKGILLIMIVFAAIRYYVGWDYAAYYDNIMNKGIWDDPESLRFTWYWRKVFELAYNFHCPHLGIVIPNIMSYVIFYFSLKLLGLNKRQQVDALVVYVFWPVLYLSTFSTIRQGLAICIGFLLFSLINQKKFILAIFAFLFAIHIHPSAFVLILLFPIYFIRKRLNLKYTIIGSIFVGIMLWNVSVILESLAFADMDNYGYYLNFDDNFGGKVLVVNTFMIVYLVFVFSKTKVINSIERQSLFLALTSFIGYILIFLSGMPNVFNRILSYFVVFMTVCLIPSFDLFPILRKWRQLVVLILPLYMIVYLYVVSDAKMESGFLPYQTIFFK